ncbi:MAG: Unknown protein [uncultured Aureispira sp.]|uniref:Uncharacterized protein n=1 Tax=uncultured Aureispira sp. TaxID=1331704 RepID=A0A6S6U492_9BACT|nr:MAG: Unknown protein [uncultured Aureispira sp.]
MKPFDLNAEFLGVSLFPAIWSFRSFVKDNMLKTLEEEGILEPDVDTWYDIKMILNFYKNIVKNYGPHTTFQLGKSIPGNAVFPPNMDTIQKGFELINVGYHMNHRNGYVGFYKLVSHDMEKKEIVMQCYNPYPCDFDRGLFTAMARKFQSGIRVVVDETKPTKKKGGNESWYIISYR